MFEELDAAHVSWKIYNSQASVESLTFAYHLYGAVTDLQTWTFYYQGTPSLGWHSGMSSAELAAAFGRFYVATSLFFDTFRATGNVLLTVILASPVLLALERFRRRFTLEVAA